MNQKKYTTIFFNILLVAVTCALINPDTDTNKTGQQPTLYISTDPSESAAVSNEHSIIKKSDKNTSVLQNNELKSINSSSLISLSTAIKAIANNLPTNLNMNLTKMTSKIIDKLAFRLPKIIKPIAYDLLMHPDLKKKTFLGSVKIKIEVKESTDFIALHSKKLNISKVWLETAEELKAVKLTQSFEYEKYEYFILESEQTIEKGLYLINLEFDGSLDNRIVGFYGSTYLDPVKNETRYIATSKFEPTFARQAFPCFDEPDMKAQYKIALVSPLGDGYSALSNLDVERTEDDIVAGTRTTHFRVSVPMSTYLAVFIVSDFLSVSTVVDTKGVGAPFILSVYSTPHQVSKLDFALQTGKGVTEFYLNYFQIPYPLPKLDMAAIPDFVSGAMETWGLITYRETNLFFDPAVSSTINQQRVANVIAHEIAHMWFGNLVTMKWWNELWLNEGFASYIEYKGIDAVYNGWGMLDQFLIDDLHGVMNLDATLGSHPIVQTVETPDQITSIFDSITYSKGASVIRMLEAFVGPENFRTGVQNYLRRHALGNAVTDDLLNELNLLNLGYNVNDVMSTWTKQKGLPVVSVERTGRSSFRLTQKRFLADPDNEGVETDSEYNYKWYIPITFITDKNNTVESTWFTNNDTSIEIHTVAGTEWLKINNDQIGYYRVKYEYDMWLQLSKALETDVNSMSTLNRAHLLNDAFSLAEAQQLQYEVPLALTAYMKNEKEYVPWAVVASKLKTMHNLLNDNPIQPKLKTYVQNLVQDVYTAVGWEMAGTHSNNLLRITILDLACTMGLPSCLQQSNTLFTAWLANPSVRPIPDVRTSVYNGGMASASPAQWNQVAELFANEQDAQEKVKLMVALARSTNPTLLTSYIESGTNRSIIRDQDYFTFIQSIAANPIGEPLVWNYVKENWLSLVDRFGLNERNLGRMIPSITGRFVREEQLQDVKDFFQRYPDSGAGATARIQTIETIENNIKWLAKNQQAISDFLDTVV